MCKCFRVEGAEAWAWGGELEARASHVEAAARGTFPTVSRLGLGLQRHKVVGWQATLVEALGLRGLEVVWGEYSGELAAGENPGIMRRAMMRLGILGSGRGSNFGALLEAAREGRLDAAFALVASDQPGSGILGRAREAGLPTLEIHEPRYRTRLSTEVEERLASDLLEAGCGLIVLAGYMRMVKEPLLAAFPRRIVNIHPSLLPKYPGLEAWRQALEAGEAEAGCTVHWVDAGMDTGEILAQARVPILPGDTPSSLHARIQIEEHRLLPEVVARLARSMP